MKKYFVDVRNEKGAQALEWVALGLVVIAIITCHCDGDFKDEV